MSGSPSEESAAQLDTDLGIRWELARNGFKPYACGVVAHPAIDAVRALATDHGVRPEEIESIRLLVHPLVVELTAKPAPRTGLEGKFSIAFACAIAMLDGAARERQFTDENVVRPDVVALRDRITPTAHPGMAPDAATAVARLHDGRELRSHVAHATGTPENPMTDDELHAKFHDLAGGIIGRERAERLAAAIDELDAAPDLSAFGDAVSPAR